MCIRDSGKSFVIFPEGTRYKGEEGGAGEFKACLLYTSYRRAFKRNFKASIAPGIFYCVVVTAQIFLCLLYTSRCV